MKLTWQDFEDAAISLDCDISAIRAVCEVEAPRGGFNPDGTPVTLFEGHKFYKYTDGKYAIAYPDLCYPVWTKAHYGKTWQQEQARLTRAKILDHDAALMSASWGKFQIMGFNYEAAGFTNVRDFVAAMGKTEREHLMAFVSFVRNEGIDGFLRNHEWASFARKYNGASYVQNQYDVKMKTAYEKFTRESTEAIVESVQESPVKAPTALTGILAFLKFIIGLFGKKQ